MFLLRIFAAKNSQKRSLAFASTRNSGGNLALSVTSSTGPAKGIVQVCSAPGSRSNRDPCNPGIWQRVHVGPAAPTASRGEQPSALVSDETAVAPNDSSEVSS